MATVELASQQLVLHLHGYKALLALRRSVAVPFAKIGAVHAHPREARFDDAIVASWAGIGVYVYGRFAIGTVELADGRSFFDVHDPARSIGIDLVHHPWKHLVVEVDDESPEAAAIRIIDTLDAWRRPSAAA